MGACASVIVITDPALHMRTTSPLGRQACMSLYLEVCPTMSHFINTYQTAPKFRLYGSFTSFAISYHEL